MFVCLSNAIQYTRPWRCLHFCSTHSDTRVSTQQQPHQHKAWSNVCVCTDEWCGVVCVCVCRLLPLLPSLQLRSFFWCPSVCRVFDAVSTLPRDKFVPLHSFCRFRQLHVMQANIIRCTVSEACIPACFFKCACREAMVSSLQGCVAGICGAEVASSVCCAVLGRICEGYITAVAAWWHVLCRAE